MKKLPGFKNHNCYCEQKIAYNFLFTDGHINNLPIDKIIQHVDRAENIKKYDIEAIKKCIKNNFDQYIKKPFIAADYSEIAERLVLN